MTVLDFAEACRAVDGRVRQNGEEDLLERRQLTQPLLSVSNCIRLLSAICKKLKSDK